MFPPAVPSVAATQVSAGAALLDVREDEEWQSGHIEGALHIPLAEIPQRLGEIPTDGELVVVCRMGARSARAVAWLAQNGVDAVNLDGGMSAWAEAGLPIVSETGAEPFIG
jgi:rhodanese-related sulfurtransferase